MKLFPLVLRFQIQHQKRGTPNLWLPVFLLWPLFFLLMGLLFVMGFLGTLIFDTRSVGRFLFLSVGICRVLCELRGTRIDVGDHENRVFIAIH